LNDEISKLVKGKAGLRKREQVLDVCRLMVRAETVDHRLSLLHVLKVCYVYLVEEDETHKLVCDSDMWLLCVTGHKRDGAVAAICGLARSQPDVELDGGHRHRLLRPQEAGAINL
jgi:hypothetical protein